MCAVFTITANVSNTESFAKDGLVKEGLVNTGNSNSFQISERVAGDYMLAFDTTVEQHTLDNGLTAFLVHDPKVTDTTVSITVKSGSYDDPEEVNGLARYLEHMVLHNAIDSGSPTSLKEFVRDNFGHIQANTSVQHTTYELSVDSELFANVLPIFVQQISQPDFNINSITGENSSFDDEWQNSKSSLHFVLSRVNAMTANQAHPISNFQLGNAESIHQYNGAELQQFLQEFHKTHYIAKNMQLAIVSNLPQEQVKEIATDSFVTIPDSKPQAKTKLPSAYLAAHLRKHIYVSTDNDEKVMMMQFPLKNGNEVNNFDSHKYLEFLFSIQQTETLATQLISQGLIRYMSPLIEPNAHMNEGSASFIFGLTAEGEQKKRQIITALLRYVDIIKQQGFSEDHARVFAQHLKSQHQQYYYDAPSRLAQKLSTQSAKEFADNGIKQTFTALNKQDLYRLLDQLTIDNLRIWHVNDEYKTDRKVDFAQATFAVTPFAEQDLTITPAHSVPELNLPRFESAINVSEISPQDYLTPKQVKNGSQALDDCSGDSVLNEPLKIFDEKHVKAWHATSNFAEEHHVFVGLRLLSGRAALRQDAPILLKLASVALSKTLLPIRNEAQLRDNLSLLSSINNNDELFITLSGPSDNHTRYVEQIIEQVNELSISEQTFRQAVEEIRFSFTNITNTATIAQSQYYTQALVTSGSSAVDINDTIENLDKITHKTFVSYVETLVKHMSVELFVFGTPTPQSSEQLAASIEQHLNSVEDKQPSIKSNVNSLPDYCSFAKLHRQRQSSVSVSYVVEHPEATTIANQLVLKSLLQNSRLRREFAANPVSGQLICLHQMLKGHSALTISVLSTRLTTKQMKQSLTNWLAMATNHVARLSQFEIERAKDAWLRRLNTPPSSFFRELTPLLADWLNGDDSFSTKSKVIEAIGFVSQRTLQQEFERLLNNSKTKKFQITLKGQAT